MIGKVRVGRRIYKYGGSFYQPTIEGFTNIIVMIKNDPNKSEYGALSPYSIKVPLNGFLEGVIHENYWQFLKVYEQVPPISVPFSTNNSAIAWVHEGCTCINKDGNITSEWHDWRERGFSSKNYIRFPKDRASCKFSLEIKKDGTIDIENRLTYVQSCKKTYAAKYCENVNKHPLFTQLKERLLNGENLLIIEVDGPHQESLQYYIDKYNVEKNFITDNSIEVTFENMKILIEDTKHAFGHDYCLGIELLDFTDKIINQ
uniref:Uncharacterized protein n=1 Tax=viral metagenome TaxID=1070528 RepID=A0A6C0EED9_9ZZZZ